MPKPHEEKQHDKQNKPKNETLAYKVLDELDSIMQGADRSDHGTQATKQDVKVLKSLAGAASETKRIKTEQKNLKNKVEKIVSDTGQDTKDIEKFNNPFLDKALGATYIAAETTSGMMQEDSQGNEGAEITKKGLVKTAQIAKLVMEAKNTGVMLDTLKEGKTTVQSKLNRTKKELKDIQTNYKIEIKESREKNKNRMAQRISEEHIREKYKAQIIAIAETNGIQLSDKNASKILASTGGLQLNKSAKLLDAKIALTLKDIESMEGHLKDATLGKGSLRLAGQEASSQIRNQIASVENLAGNEGIKAIKALQTEYRYASKLIHGTRKTVQTTIKLVNAARNAPGNIKRGVKKTVDTTKRVANYARDIATGKVNPLKLVGGALKGAFKSAGSAVANKALQELRKWYRAAVFMIKGFFFILMMTLVLGLVTVCFSFGAGTTNVGPGLVSFHSDNHERITWISYQITDRVRYLLIDPIWNAPEDLAPLSSDIIARPESCASPECPNDCGGEYKECCALNPAICCDDCGGEIWVGCNCEWPYNTPYRPYPGARYYQSGDLYFDFIQTRFTTVGGGGVGAHNSANQQWTDGPLLGLGYGGLFGGGARVSNNYYETLSAEEA